MPDSIIITKPHSIERCTMRAREELAAADDFETDYTHQDAAVLNVLRACEAAIDIGNRLLRVKRLPPPSKTAEIFELLADHKVITADLAERMKTMVGFRNRVVHDYPEADVIVIERIIRSGLDDLSAFGTAALIATGD